MPEKFSIYLSSQLISKTKVKLEDVIILDKTKEKQNYNDIVSQHSSDIGLTHLE